MGSFPPLKYYHGRTAYLAARNRQTLYRLLRRSLAQRDIQRATLIADTLFKDKTVPLDIIWRVRYICLDSYIMKIFT